MIALSAPKRYTGYWAISNARPSIMSIQLLIADDQEIVRAGLAQWLAGEIEIVGQAATVDDLFRLADACQPDVVLSEVRLRDADALQPLAVLKQRQPELAVVVFSAFDSPTYAARALAASSAICALSASRPANFCSGRMKSISATRR